MGKNIGSSLNQNEAIPPELYQPVIDSIVAETGKEKSRTIPILQAVQAEFGYLPKEALKYICEATEISPARLSGIATFYSQFRHWPAGEHVIKVCTGTACHVKGASLVSDAIRRELKLTNLEAVSEDRLFSLEEVACLGCCTLAPVIIIGNQTYGHVKTNEVKDILQDFLRSEKEATHEPMMISDDSYDTEIRVGLGSCCLAGGSGEIIRAAEKTVQRYGIQARIKPVGCVGACSQTPLVEMATRGSPPVRYPRVAQERVNELILHHLQPPKWQDRLKAHLIDWLDTMHTDNMLASPTNQENDVRENQLINFLEHQKHIATEHYGEISPLSLDEYVKCDGFKALNTVLKTMNPEQLTESVIASKFFF